MDDRCTSELAIDDGAAVRCDLECGHTELHEHVLAGIGTITWVDAT